jgi:hypothetical protein
MSNVSTFAFSSARQAGHDFGTAFLGQLGDDVGRGVVIELSDDAGEFGRGESFDQLRTHLLVEFGEDRGSIGFG